MDLNALKDLNLFSVSDEKAEDGNNNTDIAIVGIDAKISGANSIEEIWQALISGNDLIREFPEERVKDANNISLLRTGKPLSKKILPYGYLDQIDLFDPEVFSISNQEAKLMDPTQRIFLQSALLALEDAGQGGNKLNNSKTGVYIGLNNINNQYCGTMGDQMDAISYGLAVSGNVNSIVASRISYYLNLKGPAVVFDTACSSSLVAVHFACQQLKSQEISTAITGGVRIVINPPQGLEQNFGIESSTGRTRSFDANSDGTGGGEGVVTLVLKRLEDALEENSQIYAVIKGSSINQDGSGIGITAPNSIAQSEVLKEAWEESGIEPETISYIETHGTGTKLGDPIEIEGIEKAFRDYTDNSQFCAIGSVKSNVGHLDSASGIVGLLKTILMLKYKKIPPSLHFKEPNPKINFINSPVYINDFCTEWETDCIPRRAGVSTFGISGTNCHLVLQEADELEKVERRQTTYPLIMTISAKNEKSLKRYVESYKKFLLKNPECDLNNFCYSTNMGKKQYNSRYFVVLKDDKDVYQWKTENWLQDSGIHNSFKLIEADNGIQGYLSFHSQQEMTNEANKLLSNVQKEASNINDYSTLVELGNLFCSGADINWESFYKNNQVQRISIPVYPYDNRRYWHDIKYKKDETIQNDKNKAIHPLIDSCVMDSYNLKVFEKVISSKTSWELGEHRLNGVPVLPGSALIEIANIVAQQVCHSKELAFYNLRYPYPLICPDETKRIMQIISKTESDKTFITIVSKNLNEDWIVHLEVTVKRIEKNDSKMIDVKNKLSELEEITESKQIKKVEIASIVGEHWNNLEKIYTGKNDVVLLLKSNNASNRIIDKYEFYPPLLDSAINGGTYIAEGEYLPFTFEKAIFYHALPKHFFSFIHKKKVTNDGELITFDITITTVEGEVIAEFTDYVIRQVKESSNFITNLKLQRKLFHSIEWQPQALDAAKVRKNIGGRQNVLVFYSKNQEIEKLKKSLNKNLKLIFICIDGTTNKVENDHFQIKNSYEDFTKIVEKMKHHKISQIIQFIGYNSDELRGYSDLKDKTALLLKSTMLSVKALVNNEFKNEVDLVLVTKNALKLNKNDNIFIPINNALIGMGTSIESEYNNIKVKAIDLDEVTSLKMIWNELEQTDGTYLIAYRENERYIQNIKEEFYLESINNINLGISSKGIYIISGGLGGMGIAFTQQLLAINNRAKIILLNRSYTDHQFELLNNNMLTKEQKKLKEMRQKGSHVKVIKTDISSEEQVKKVIKALRNEYGKINGIINAAGVPGDGFLMNKDWESFEKILQPKIYGTWNLHSATLDDELQFFILCSSLTSIFGAPGQSDYAAANAYLDSFSYYRNSLGKKTLSINWTGWSGSGMAKQRYSVIKDTYVNFLSDSEGTLAFLYSAKSDLERLLIGQFNIPHFKNNFFIGKGRITINQLDNKIETNYLPDKIAIDSLTNIEISGKSMDQLTRVEKEVISVWSNVLNSDKIDVYDKFFEVGGNSLLALNLQKELNEKLSINIAITDIFTHSTILEISNFITSTNEEYEQKKSPNGSFINDDLDYLYSKIMNGELDETLFFD